MIKKWPGTLKTFNNLTPILTGFSGLQLFRNEPSFVVRGYGNVGSTPPILFWDGEIFRVVRKDSEGAPCYNKDEISVTLPNTVRFHDDTIETGKTAVWTTKIAKTVGIDVFINPDVWVPAEPPDVAIHQSCDGGVWLGAKTPYNR